MNSFSKGMAVFAAVQPVSSGLSFRKRKVKRGLRQEQLR